MKVPIKFIDSSGQETANYVDGLPVVEVLAEIGFKLPSNPDTQFTPNFKPITALVDTGADCTTIRPDLAAGLTSIGTARAFSMLGHGYSSVHNALIKIVGFTQPVYLEVGTAPLKSIQMVLGREAMTPGVKTLAIASYS